MNELEDTIVTADYNYEWKVIITFQSHVLKQDLIDNCDCILRMQHSLEKITLELSRCKSGGGVTTILLIMDYKTGGFFEITLTGHFLVRGGK